ncbi:MAG: sensor histidine kinase, partial [bacterium]
QPFSRTKQAVQSVIPGTGLGLYVSKILIEAHGGTIALSSGEGKGTTVTVRLPVKEEECRE